MAMKEDVRKFIEDNVELEIGEAEGKRALFGRYTIEFYSTSDDEDIPDSIEDLDDVNDLKWEFSVRVMELMEQFSGLRGATIRDVVDTYDELSGDEHESFRRDLAKLLGKYREGYMLKPRRTFDGKRNFSGVIDWHVYGWPMPTPDYEGVDVGDMPEDAYEEWLYECKRMPRVDMEMWS